ncbi:MAG: helix-hairpin-helix domain-containing protein [Chitinophagales bacterium]|nr:helix-hairpin-helix domain-containing protein [Chitinophagales bacterium]
MKQYPFWKVWYFTREQRKGLVMIIFFVLLLILIKGPITNYSRKTKEAQLVKQNQQIWSQLKSQMDSSKALSYQRQMQGKEDSNIKSMSEGNKDIVAFEKHREQRKNTRLIIDINKATIDDFIQIRGIGKVFSDRIIKYRTKLGGFYSLEQINEVYGINDSIFLMIKPQLKISTENLIKIDINHASIEDLQTHPYISKTLSKQIIGYRQKVKPFENIDDVKKLYAMNDSIFNKLKHYLIIY